MSDTIPQATPLDLVQAAREMIRAKGAPSNAENLNRAMLAISRGQETTDFDSRLDAMANGDRGGRGASRGTGRNGGSQRGANARGDVASADVAEVNRTGRAPANRPQPSTPGTTARTGGNEDRPPETARAGDADRPLTTAAVDPMGNATGATLDLEGTRTAPGGGAPRVPGTKQASGSSGYVNLPLEDRPARGTAQAATPSSDVTGTPEPGQTPGFRQSLVDQGMLTPEGGVNWDDSTNNTMLNAIMGAGRGFGIAGRPPISVGRPPGTQPQLSRGPDATASPMGGPDGRIVQLPQLPAPPTGLPAPAQGLPAPPPGIGAPPAGLPPPQAALPSSYGPPVPRGNLNSAPPQGPIPMQSGASQARQMGMPQSTRDNIIGNTEALIRQLRARRAG